MKKQKDKKELNKTHSLIHYMGRVIYNFDQTNYEYEKNAINLFRKKEYTNLSDLDKNYSVICDNISEAIPYKTLIDKSINSEIDLIPQEKICNFSYSTSIKLNNCTSNPEVHYFSKTNGLHITKVESLSSYKNIEFTCWNGINNENIQNMLKGENEVEDDNESIALSQTLSLFLCESSRNPVSFFTAPMCFELSEYWYNKKSWGNKKEKENFLKEIPESIKKGELTAKTKESDIENIIKKNTILEYFPMVIDKAVAGSRAISNILNKKLEKLLPKESLSHKYDNDLGSIIDAKRLIEKEKQLISIWENCFECQISDHSTCIDFIERWYNITFEETDFPSTKFLGDLATTFNDL